MNDVEGEHAGPMTSPANLGEFIRHRMDEVGWNRTNMAARIGCERGTSSPPVPKFLSVTAVGRFSFGCV